MDREQWTSLRTAVGRACRALGRHKRVRFSDRLIVLMYLWAVAHDRCQSWACDRQNYGGVFRARKLPSVSQFNRRLADGRTLRVLQLVHQEVAGVLVPTAISYLDAKPLPVGAASKDPDARRGHVMGGLANGYKLHAWVTQDRRIPLWCVRPLNEAEAPIAGHLIMNLPRLSERSLVLADQNYDSHDLHKAVDAQGGRLLVWPKGGGAARHEVTMRQMGPARRELIAVCAQSPVLLKMVHKQRIAVEGTFSNLCSYGGGLGPLPAWVRRLKRVRRWVGAKLILYHVRTRNRRLAMTR